MLSSFILLSLIFSSVFSTFYSVFFYFIPFSFILLCIPLHSCFRSLSFLFLFDEFSLFLTYILFCVIFLSLFWFMRFHRLSLIFFIMLFIIFSCYLVFSTNYLILLYASYELSLIPIILIIVIWGSYPERSLSCIILLIYTSVFTIPLISVLFFIYFLSFSFSFYLISDTLSLFISFLLFLAFAVKLPIYGLHFWLPMAHVEAPTFGSIILAGVLLKLGGIGLIRCYSIINWNLMETYLLSYLLFFLVYSAFICSFQNDFKRLVAYSSVAHIIVVPILLVTYSTISQKSILLILVFHGLSSPILFSLVGFIYSIYITRQLVLIRGLILILPLTSLVCIIGFLFRLCIPPFPSYVSEVMFFMSRVSLYIYMPVLLVIFRILCLLYNIRWLASCLFSRPSPVSFTLASTCYVTFFSSWIFSAIGLFFIFFFLYM
jgi:NADH:ubiquinone oxidoreductase subunit 4 (subunit M)